MLGRGSGLQPLRYKAGVIFALTSLLPLLLFVFFLDQKGLLEDQKAMLVLGLSTVVAILGFALFLQIARQMNHLAEDFRKLERGEITELPDRSTAPRELAEMASMTEAFRNILMQLQTCTADLENLISKLSTLSEVTELVSRIPNINEVLQLVLYRAMAAVAARIGSIMLLDEATQTLRIAAAEGLDEAIVVGTTVQLGEGIAGQVAQTGEPVLVEDVEHDQRFGKMNDPKYLSSSFICMPLRAQQRIIGVLNLSKKEGYKTFSELDLKFLSTLLNHIGFAVENARLLKDAKEAALNLRQVIQEKTSQLQQAQELLQQRGQLAMPQDFLTRVGHELHPALLAAVGYAQVLTGQLQDQSMQRAGQRIVREVGGALETVHNLLVFAEPPPLVKRLENLNNIVAQVLERQAYQLRTDDITVQADLAADLPPLLVDALMLREALGHLVRNACQAMESQETPRCLRIRTFQEGDSLGVEIADTGPGSALQHMDHIFQPFFSTRALGKGMGLGLSIAQDTAQRHQGTLRVTSQPGPGATFQVKLPLEKEN